VGNAGLEERIAANVAEIMASIAEVCWRSGRDTGSVRLVAVSKTVGLPEIDAAIAAGLSDFGENRSQDFVSRQAAFKAVNWHFIGRIQTNKVRDFVQASTEVTEATATATAGLTESTALAVAPIAALVHSVASERALLAIDRRATSLAIRQPLLIEVNTSGESTKDGVTLAGLPKLLETASNLASVSIEGLMTMAPIADTDTVRQCFSALREARDAMQASFAGSENLRLNELSMGMSDDFIPAIEEGATILRIGRGIWR
jgi:uncharacterized pyridoxal phosphate-containing UPF0001 family protein